MHAKYIHGFTATPKRQDGLEKLMHFQLGLVAFKATSTTSSFEQHVRVVNTATRFPPEWLIPETKPHISQVYKHLVCDQDRNEMIVNSIKQSVDNNRSVMVLTERKEHIELLTEMMADKRIKVVELHGGISTKQRQDRIALLSNKPSNDEPVVILATGKYVGEGFELPHLDTLYITLPIAWKGILAQYAGRIQREWNNKTVIQVYDFRKDFSYLQTLKQDEVDYEVKWGQLLLEQSALTQPSRLEQAAIKDLNMHAPSQGELIIVKP